MTAACGVVVASQTPNRFLVFFAVAVLSVIGVGCRREQVPRPADDKNRAQTTSTQPNKATITGAHSRVDYKEIRRAADQGDAPAQYRVGRMYEEGIAVTRDSAEAVRWYRKAAEQGMPIAQYTLAQAYNYGTGVPKDDAQAVKWYRRVAEKGNSRLATIAQWALGWKYEAGQGVPRSYVEAYTWYNIAAGSGAGRDIVARDPFTRIAPQMTPAQIAGAQERARGWMEALEGSGSATESIT
jgi:TPR repeat protein